MAPKSAPTLSQEVSILHHIIETISYNTDLDDTLKEIISVVDSVAHADEIFVYLPKGKKIVLRAAKKDSQHLVDTVSLALGEGITGWVAQKQTPVVLSKGATKDKRYVVVDELEEDAFDAFLSMPLIYKKKVVGVFNVQHKNAHTFTKREMKLLESIAHAAAGAIEHARLIEENMVLSETLQSRKTIDRAKGKLMKHNGLSEAEAYDWLKKRAMDLRKSMKDVAEAILISLE